VCQRYGHRSDYEQTPDSVAEPPSNPGQTHYYGDDCDPPHEPPPGWKVVGTGLFRDPVPMTDEGSRRALDGLEAPAMSTEPLDDSGEPRRSEEPQDRLTRICDDMTKTFDLHPEHLDTDRCMVFLDDPVSGRAGMVAYAWENDAEAIAHLFMHIRAMFRAQGRDLEIIAIPDDPSELDQ
jgi:hypothetical protein